MVVVCGVEQRCTNVEVTHGRGLRVLGWCRCVRTLRPAVERQGWRGGGCTWAEHLSLRQTVAEAD